MALPRRLFELDSPITTDLFSNWQTFEQFSSIVDEASSVGDEAVTSPHYQRWRDAWIAREVARCHGASHVGLIDQDRPDFEIRVNEEEFEYEATEALKPERRRHDEYRAFRLSGATSIDDPQDSWVTPEDVLNVIHQRATDKGTKDYPVGCRLVMFVNVGWINGPKPIDASLIDQLGITELQNAVGPARARFSRIELLHQKHVIAI